MFKNKGLSLIEFLILIIMMSAMFYGISIFYNMTQKTVNDFIVFKSFLKANNIEKLKPKIMKVKNCTSEVENSFNCNFLLGLQEKEEKATCIIGEEGNHCLIPDVQCIIYEEKENCKKLRVDFTKRHISNGRIGHTEIKYYINGEEV